MRLFRVNVDMFFKKGGCLWGVKTGYLKMGSEFERDMRVKYGFSCHGCYGLADPHAFYSAGSTWALTVKGI